MRGRNNNGGGNNNNNNNNNRRGPNPLTRNYESNGPDVKIRGSAQQIAEKYATLARDAQSAGDRVMAENYLQHAEHYNRIIAAAQAQMPQPIHSNRDDLDEDADQDRDDFEVNGTQPSHHVERPAANQAPSQEQVAAPVVEDGSGPQPEIAGTPAEVALKSETPAAPAPARGRGRRAKPAAEVNEPSTASADVAGPVAEAAEETADQPQSEEAAAAPRRSRRPRRGERRGDEDAASASGNEASANDGGPEAAAVEQPAGDTVLAAANS